jgi:hypothetical protein
MPDPFTLPSGEPWRLLVLDAAPGNTRLMLAVVTDVRPAVPGESVTEVSEWIRAATGAAHALTRLPGAVCWHIDGTR